MTKIAGEVRFSLDMRSLDGEFLDSMTARVRELSAEIAQRRDVNFELGDFTRADTGP